MQNQTHNELDYESALCAQTDPELFFPEKGGTAEPAKRICQSCPIKTECLIEALVHNYEDGIWGGLAPKERKALKHQKNKAISLGVAEVVFNRTRKKRGRNVV